MGLAELTYSTPCVGKVKRDFSLQPYCRFAYSALASFRMGISGSASFQRESSQPKSARTKVVSASAPCEVFACKAVAQITSRRAKRAMKGCSLVRSAEFCLRW